MKKIFDVDVFGLKTPVYVQKGLVESGMYGCCKFDKSPPIIILDQDLTIKDFTETLAHEMIHIMVHRINLQLTEEIEEQICETTIIPLFENLEIRLSDRLQKLLEKNHPSSQEL